MSQFWELFKAGNNLIAAQDFAAAEVKFNEAIAASTDHKERALALENLYIVKVRIGDIQSGIHLLNQAMETDPESPHKVRMLCALARQHTFSNELDKALGIQDRLFEYMGWDHARRAGYNFTQELWFARNHETFDEVLSLVKASFKKINVIEIGSLQGMSACYIADALHGSSKFRLFCIDPQFQPEFRPNTLKSLGAGRIYPIELKSQDILPLFEPGSFQLVHVDGWHVAPQVFFDGFLAIKSLTKGGIIIFDDYLKEDQTRIGQTVKMGVQSFWAVFSRWLDVVVDGRQLVCRLHSEIEPAQVADPLSIVLTQVLGRDIKIGRSASITSWAEIYNQLLPHTDELVKGSWRFADKLPVPTVESIS